MKRTGKIILYAVFTLLVSTIFLFYRFPAEMAKQLIDQYVAQVQPDIQVQSSSISPTFPPGIHFEPLTVSYAGLPVLKADRFSIRPEILTLFRSEKNFSFKGSIHNGQIKGNVDVLNEANRPQARVAFNLIAIPMEALDLSRQWPSFQPSGDINAYVDYDTRKGPGGTANVTLDIVPVKIAMNPPLMGLEQIEFSQLKAEIAVTNRMLQIRRCEAEGPQFEGKISGSIIFSDPISNSRLTLSCTLRPQPAFIAEHQNDMLGGLISAGNAMKRGLVFRISGTMANPQYVIR
jgi:type II secretion system protein N